MDGSPLEFLEEILKIYSPPMREGQLSRFLKDRMSGKLGFSNVRTDSLNNVYGEIGSGETKLLLCGHMDTVPGRQPVKVTNELIYGRGASDAKSALAAMIWAASSFSQKSLDGKILMVGVTDEEGNGRGIKELIRSGVKADNAIFGEPSGIDNITIGYKGRLVLKIRCETASVHASAPWMSENAVERIMEVWLAVKDYAKSKKCEGSYYNSLSICLTQIKGGSAHNVTPGECEITLDVRVPKHLSCGHVRADLEDVVSKFQVSVSFPKIQTEVQDMTEPFETEKSSTLIRALTHAILKVREKRPILLRKTGTGDMNVLGHALNIPVVTYGPGNPHLSHTRKEYVEISGYLASIEVYKHVIMNLFKI